MVYLYTDTNKNKYMWLAFSRSFFLFEIFNFLNRFIPGGFYFRMFLYFNMLNFLNMNIIKLLGVLELIAWMIYSVRGGRRRETMVAGLEWPFLGSGPFS